MKHNRIGYLIKEGFRGIFTHGFMSFACIVVIVACLLIMGSFALLALNIDHNIDELEHENEILAYLGENLTDEEIASARTRAASLSNVSSVVFVSREQAFEDFKSQYSDADFSDLDASVLRDRFVIYLEDLSMMDRTTEDIRAIEGVDDVSASLEISRAFITLRNIVSVVSAILIVILFVVSIFIMQNTIKLATFARREEIGIMKIVGASNFFIHCPFVIEGLVLGLLGGAIAFFIMWGVYTFVINRVMVSVMANLLSIIPFETIMYPMLIIFLAIGLLVGTFGSNIAIRNYLKV